MNNKNFDKELFGQVLREELRNLEEPAKRAGALIVAVVVHVTILVALGVLAFLLGASEDLVAPLVICANILLMFVWMFLVSVWHKYEDRMGL